LAMTYFSEVPPMLAKYTKINMVCTSKTNTGPWTVDVRRQGWPELPVTRDTGGSHWCCSVGLTPRRCRYGWRISLMASANIVAAAGASVDKGRSMLAALWVQCGL